jgi:alpha-1,2-glucosyltransferase
MRAMPTPASDEWVYQFQIHRFHDGVWKVHPGITMLPGYFLVVGLITRLFGEYADTTARLVNLAGSIPLLFLARSLVERAWPGQGWIRAAQVLFLPLLYPFFFLMYTETWSLVCLTGMLLAALGGRTMVAALVAVAGMAIRQDFVIWAAFAFLLVCLEKDTWRGRVNQALVVGWPLIGAGLAFVAFFAWNGFSVALGDQSMHAKPHNVTNLSVCLLYGFAAFLPYHAWNAPGILALSKHAWALALVVAGFAFYWLTFSNSHVYNENRFWLHNELLYWMTRLPALRALLYVPAAWCALSWAASRLPERRLEWLYAFLVASVVLHPLVEERYYLPGLVLFNLWRPAMPVRWEAAMLALYVPASLYILWGITTIRFFP